MSGGHFDYKQSHILDIANEISNIIKNNDIKDEYGYSTSFCDITLKRLSYVESYLERAYRMANLIDRLVSGDTSEESFLEEWEGLNDKIFRRTDR